MIISLKAEGSRLKRSKLVSLKLNGKLFFAYFLKKKWVLTSIFDMKLKHNCGFKKEMRLDGE